MTAEQRPDEQLGTGASRSELDDEAPAVTPMVRNDSLADPGIVTTMGVGSHPGLADDMEPNRSGSGGSGGPVDPDASPQEEGSGGESMAEMLGDGEEDTLARGGTPDPRGY